jgi:putative colanic acid biosysnthesis UDP-glucose lipid carrier transferase
MTKQDRQSPAGAGTANLLPKGLADEGRKWPIRYDFIEPLTILADIATIVLSSLIAGPLYHYFLNTETANYVSKSLGSAIIVSVLFISLMKIRGMYEPVELLVLPRQIRAVWLAWISAFLLLAGTIFALRIGSDISRGASILFALLGLMALIAQRRLLEYLLAKGLAEKRFSVRNVVLITDDSSKDTTNLAQALMDTGFRVKRNFLLPASSSDPGHRQRVVTNVIEYVHGSDIEEIVVGANPDRWSELRSLGAELGVLPFPISFVPLGPASEIYTRPSRKLGNTIGVELRRGPLTPVERAAKRSIDVLLAGWALIAFLPVLVIAAVAIKLDSRGPIFFRQTRFGFNGRGFQIYKFRTMSVLEDSASIVQAQSGDKRTTWLGAWLRRTSIDELPQLFNVLDGSMSLVGPRPYAVAHDNEFDKIVRNYAFRHRVKPGLTGWAQVHGLRGTPTPRSIEERVEFDLWYINNWSLSLDIAILLRTPIELMRGSSSSTTSRTRHDPPTQVQTTEVQFPLAQRRGDPVQHPSNLSVGNHRYPLRSTAVLRYDGSVMQLGYLEAFGQTWDAAFDSISHRLHRHFQRLWLVPPHERSADEQAQLEKMAEIVDIEEYLRTNQQEELVIGRIDAIDDYVVRLTLMTHDDQEITAPISDLPAIAAGMQSGHYFEARILREHDQRIEWKSWSVRPPLREDDDAWTDFDQLAAQGTLE